MERKKLLLNFSSCFANKMVSCVYSVCAYACIQMCNRHDGWKLVKSGIIKD